MLDSFSPPSNDHRPADVGRRGAPLPGSAGIANFISSLSVDERREMKQRLSDRIAEFFDDSNSLRGADSAMKKRFDMLAETLRNLTPNAQTIPVNGIAYRGRPDWLTPDLLGKLQQEAEHRQELPLDRIDHYLGCGGRHADVLSVSPEILAFVGAQVGSVAPTGIASYMYYDRAGLGIRPHVDTEVFSVNMMLMLRHDHAPDVERSATVVFPAYCSAEFYRLEVGEVMLMHGSSVIHTRSLVQPGERIHLLTLGFNRI
ncbi:MAG TPA: hypothetical protein VF800_22855 [Telluria sp.]